MTRKVSEGSVKENIRRKTQKKYSAEERVRVVPENLRGKTRSAEALPYGGDPDRPPLPLEQGFLGEGRQRLTEASKLMHAQHTVSIGIPIYNGEYFLISCLESILGQTHNNIEVIISDNASTDQTEAICKRYAERHRCIQYSRRDKNYGAAANFNYVFEKCRGKYFKWAAHDDLLAPTYVEQCVAALEANPDAVGAQSQTVLIDEAGERLQPAGSSDGFVDRAGRCWPEPLDDPSLAETRDPVARFRGIIETFKLDTSVFGVYRREVMARTALQLPFWGADKVLIAELCLHGTMQLVREELFFRRCHSAQASALPMRDRSAWLDTGRRYVLFRTQAEALTSYIAAIARSNLNWSQKAECLAIVLKQVFKAEKWALGYLGLKQ